MRDEALPGKPPSRTEVRSYMRRSCKALAHRHGQSPPASTERDVDGNRRRNRLPAGSYRQAVRKARSEAGFTGLVNTR